MPGVRGGRGPGESGGGIVSCANCGRASYGCGDQERLLCLRCCGHPECAAEADLRTRARRLAWLFIVAVAAAPWVALALLG